MANIRWKLALLAEFSMNIFHFRRNLGEILSVEFSSLAYVPSMFIIISMSGSGAVNRLVGKQGLESLYNGLEVQKLCVFVRFCTLCVCPHPVCFVRFVTLCVCPHPVCSFVLLHLMYLPTHHLGSPLPSQ